MEKKTMALIQKIQVFPLGCLFWGLFFTSFIFGFQGHTLNFYSQAFAKFWLQKYNSNLFKGSSMEKNGPKFARL
jgi:hypothetical protein